MLGDHVAAVEAYFGALGGDERLALLGRLCATLEREQLKQHIGAMIVSPVGMALTRAAVAEIDDVTGHQVLTIMIARAHASRARSVESRRRAEVRAVPYGLIPAHQTKGNYCLPS